MPRYRNIVTMPSIPDCYKWDGEYRFISPIGQELTTKPIEQIPCPHCGACTLENIHYNFMHIVEGNKVGCRVCGWKCPTQIQPDPDDAVSDFKSWMEAFILADKPMDFLDEDLRALMYKDPEEFEENEQNDLDNFTIVL